MKPPASKRRRGETKFSKSKTLGRGSLLIPIYNPIYFASAVKTAVAIKANSSHEPIFFFPDTSIPGLSGLCAKLDELEIIFVNIENPKKRLSGSARNLIRNLVSQTEIGNFLLGAVRITTLRNQIESLFALHPIRAILMPADNRYDYQFIVKIAHTSNPRLPVALFPSWFANHLEILRTFGGNKKLVKKNLSPITGKILGNYLMPIETQKSNQRYQMIPIRTSEILLRKAFRAEAPKPWILHSGQADIIFVETKMALEYAKSLGFSPKQLSLVGSPYLDEMYEVRRRNVLTAIKGKQLTSTRPLKILCAIPPDMTAYVDHKIIEFPSYLEFLEKFINSVRRVPESEVIFTVHPTTTHIERSTIESFGAIISDKPTHCLIVESDLYVASISATIQWAIAAGVQTLNYDVFSFGYPDYESSELVTRADSFSSFENELSKLSSTIASYLDVSRADCRNSSTAELDGESARRLVMELENLISSKPSDPKDRELGQE